MNTLVVTGGCGFIGSHFVRLLLHETDWHVINFDNLSYAGILERLSDVEKMPRYHLIKGDIASKQEVDRLFRTERPRAVVNFAAETHVDRSILDAAPFVHANVVGVQVLLEAAREHGLAKFIQISTDEVYGETTEPSSEDDPLRPSSPYAASKACADLLCLAYQRTYGLPVIITRSANNYGPFQFPEKLIPLMIRNALCGEILPVYGNGQQIRDWLYVEDHCRALLLILDKGRVGNTYNLGGGDARRNLDVIHAACRLLAARGVNPGEILQRIQFVHDRPGHDRQYALNSLKARTELGWSPRVRFEEGLSETVHWYLNHQQWLTAVTSGDYAAYYNAVYNRAWTR